MSRVAGYAPHAPTDRIKLARMIRSLRKDGRDALPACWAEGDRNGHADCFEGSHRLAAWERLGMQPKIALISSDELQLAALHAGYDDADALLQQELESITDALNAWDEAGRPN